jgi:SAM-dependent methyltransferase
MRPYLDYYRENKISPVSQDISDLTRHFQRRASLYRALGAAPALIEGKSVLEFGPGSGHNALYTASLGPRRYLAVDANPTGLAELRALFGTYPWLTPPELVESYIEDFATAERFDVVICEGVIPMQNDPAAFARRVASFVRPGGVFLTTTIDGVSILADQMRRLLNFRLPRDWPIERRVTALEIELAPHVAQLPGMSRPLVDYIHDNTLQPFVGPLFSFADAVVALADDFDFYGSSPQFVLDWRWYKTLTGDDRRFNERAVDAYYRNLANVVDCRVELPPHGRADGEALMERCTVFYRALQDAQSLEPRAYEIAVDRLRDVALDLMTLSPRAGASVAEFVAYLDGDRESLADALSFWGRGQQNLSFIRTAGP